MSNQNESILEAVKAAIETDWTISQYLKGVYIVLSPADLPNIGQDTPFVLISPVNDIYKPLGMSCAASDVTFNIIVSYYEEFWAEDAGVIGNNYVAGVMKGQKDLIRLLNRNLLGIARRALYQGASYSPATIPGLENVHSVSLTFEYFYFDEGD